MTSGVRPENRSQVFFTLQLVMFFEGLRHAWPTGQSAVC